MRQSNIELCRIVSMLFIVILHSTFASFGYPEEFTSRNLFLIFLSSWSIIGVDVFLLITGYFSASIKIGSISKLLYICLYSAFISLVFLLIAAKSGLPVIYNPYLKVFFLSKSNWFVVSYLGLLIFSPVLNIFLNTAARKQLAYIIIGLFVYSFWFSLFPKQADIEPGFNYGCSVLWFIEMYLIGRYIHLYGAPDFLNKFSWGGYVISSLLLFLGGAILLYIGMGNRIGWWQAQNQPIVLFSALCLFISFQKMHIKSVLINKIAASSLTVLLLHSPVITKYYFSFIDIHVPNLLLKFLIWCLSAVCIYFICFLIDQGRLLTYKPIKKLVDRKKATII